MNRNWKYASPLGLHVNSNLPYRKEDVSRHILFIFGKRSYLNLWREVFHLSMPLSAHAESRARAAGFGSALTALFLGFLLLLFGSCCGTIAT